MPRAYTVATIALALNVPNKWVDNILSHFSVTAVSQGTQGVARRIGTEGVLELFVIKGLVQTFQIPLGRAVPLAKNLVGSGSIESGEALVLQLDRDRLRAALGKRLEFAVEAAPRPRRGRPTGKAKRGV